MNAKYLIFGATGSIGSSLAEQLKKSKYEDIHLVSRNENELRTLSEKTGYTFTVANVLEDEFLEKVKSDIDNVKGIAYCVGSIDLKPIKMTKKSDYMKSFNLNLISATEIIRRSIDSLKQNKG